MSGEVLWNERLRRFWKEAAKYLKYVLNSGMLFSLYIVFLITAYYYAKFIGHLPKGLPYPLFFTILLGLFSIRSPVRTFLERADLVFLTPQEMKLAPFFKKAFYYNFLIQGFFLIVLMIVLQPLYRLAVSESTLIFAGTVLLLLLAKGWNLAIGFAEQSFATDRERTLSVVLRVALTLTFLWFIFRLAHPAFWLFTAGIAAAVLVLYVRPLKRERLLKWERLIAAEEGKLMRFYRLIHLFVDVPDEAIRRRHDVRRKWVSSPLPWRHSFFWLHFFLLTFFRSSEYFGYFFRLTFVAALLCFAVPSKGVALFLFVLFLHMTALQLTTLYRDPVVSRAQRMHPVSSQTAARAFLRFLFVLLIHETIIISAVLWYKAASFSIFVTAVLLGIAVSAVIVFFYIRRKFLHDQ